MPQHDAPRLTFSAPATHSDWMLRDGVPWGPAGVHHMLDMCKAAGWSRVHWRALDGGRSLYASQLMDPQGKWDENSFWHPATPEDMALFRGYYPAMPEAEMADLLARLERHDYAGFDTLAEAVRYGHQIGLQVWAWVSVNEDDHGWGLQSRFSRAHPECRWVRRDGTPYRSQLSFAFPEVRAYKLAILREILDRYAVDGLFLDWLRTGDVRDNPQTDAEGVADYGYEGPLVESFRAEHGVDPADVPNGDARWVAWRARPVTEFVRAARDLVRGQRPGLPIAALVAHPWLYRGRLDPIDGNLRGMLLDVAAWARQGLVDAVCPAGYYREGGTPQSAYRALGAETAGQAEVWLYQWVPKDPAELQTQCDLALELGAGHILHWEADYIDARADKEELQAAMRARALLPSAAITP
ncbi:MAG: family 10 glycosylhydrolase [Gemmatimonadota bacterium]